MTAPQEREGDRRISLRQLAKRMRVNSSQARKYILFRLKMNPPQSRTPDSRGKRTYVFTQDEAERIVMQREAEFPDPDGTSSASSVDTESGFFYLVHLCPDLSGNRVKLGFAVNVEQRVRQHQTAAPTACLLRSWPCKPTWEAAAIDAMTKTDCTLVREEVYDCENIQGLIERGDAFFGLMPEPGSAVPLSPHSPFYETTKERDSKPDIRG